MVVKTVYKCNINKNVISKVYCIFLFHFIVFLSNVRVWVSVCCCCTREGQNSMRKKQKANLQRSKGMPNIFSSRKKVFDDKRFGKKYLNHIDDVLLLLLSLLLLLFQVGGPVSKMSKRVTILNIIFRTFHSCLMFVVKNTYFDGTLPFLLGVVQN